MNELYEDVKITGNIDIFGKDIMTFDIIDLRKKVGMVFQRPNPFPFSVYENMVYRLRIHGIKMKKVEEEELVIKCLEAVSLWDDIKDKLHKSDLELSEEMKQRLYIARLLMIKPDIILLDEPCSALDPIATMRIEELIIELKKDYTILIVTHNMQQAARVSDYTGFMLLGELIEFGETSQIFTSPKNIKTEEYITGRFG